MSESDDIVFVGRNLDTCQVEEAIGPETDDRAVDEIECEGVATKICGMLA